MAYENSMHHTILCFDGHCDHWSMLVENFKRSMEYWYIVESGVAKPEAEVMFDNGAEL